MLKIQIVSDIHAEFWAQKPKFNFIKPTAPILALLGDICCCGSSADFEVFKRFILELLPSYDKIIFIPGNHEYYFSTEKKEQPSAENTIQGIDNKIKAFFKETSDKLHFLNNSSICIETKKDTYLLCGSTLWSWIPEETREYVAANMNDYQYIFTLDDPIRQITPTDIAKLHLKNYKYIKSQIAKAKKANYKVIVFTHHKPYISESFNPSTLDVAYESDLSSIFSETVVLWAYGHTHIADNTRRGKTWLFSNPKGYPNQKTKFKPALNLQV